MKAATRRNFLEKSQNFKLQIKRPRERKSRVIFMKNWFSSFNSMWQTFNFQLCVLFRALSGFHLWLCLCDRHSSANSSRQWKIRKFNNLSFTSASQLFFWQKIHNKLSAKKNYNRRRHGGARNKLVYVGDTISSESRGWKRRAENFNSNDVKGSPTSEIGY